MSELRQFAKSGGSPSTAAKSAGRRCRRKPNYAVLRVSPNDTWESEKRLNRLKVDARVKLNWPHEWCRKAGCSPYSGKWWEGVNSNGHPVGVVVRVRNSPLCKW